MSTSLTLAQWRDETRRLLQLMPAIDMPFPGPVGDPSAACPDPPNILVTSCINYGIAMVNQAVRLGFMVDVEVPVPTADVTRKAFQPIDYSPYIPNLLNADEIENVTFDDGKNAVRLEPYDFYSRERDYAPFQQYAAGKPQQWIISGNQLGIMPPSATKGTLRLTFSTSIPPLVSDGDIMYYIPIQYQMVPIFWAVAILSGRQATDVEAIQRCQYFGELAKQGTIATYAWKNGYNDAGITSLRDTLQMIPLSSITSMVTARQAPTQTPGIGTG